MVIRPVFAPLRSITALVATVVACKTKSTDVPGTPVTASSFSSPSITASPGLRELVGTFRACVVPVASSHSTKSVKVPPMSKATRIMSRRSPIGQIDVAPSLSRELPMCVVEGAPHPRQHLVDLSLGDDEGRCKSDPIADHAQHKAMLVP